MTHDLLRRHLAADPRHAALLTNETTMNENRKRLREDDNYDFMPLSKRINNLHINNSAPIHPSLLQPPTMPPPPRPIYDPGLTPEQSQYYFNNKLLFDLYVERLQRLGQPFPQ